MRNLLFKSKPNTPADLVRQTRDLLASFNHSDPLSTGNRKIKPEENVPELIGDLILQLKTILYGRIDSDPLPAHCTELTQEFFKGNTLRLLIDAIPKLSQETRTHSTHIVSNLLRQKVGPRCRMIACDYLEANWDLIDTLFSGYDKNEEAGALHYGAMLRDCIRHQSIAKYVLESKPKMKLFFDCIQIPHFEIASDAAETFRQLLTRHKSTAALFLSENYDWFFEDYNSKLLESTNYLTRRQAMKLLGEILVDRSNSNVMARFVSSKENLRVVMNVLKEPRKGIQVDAFKVFKLFVTYDKKPTCIVNILIANRSKLVRLILNDLQMDKRLEDEQFEAEKAQVLEEIASLEGKLSP